MPKTRCSQLPLSWVDSTTIHVGMSAQWLRMEARVQNSCCSLHRSQLTTMALLALLLHELSCFSLSWP